MYFEEDNLTAPSDNSGRAVFGVYPKQRAKPSSSETKEGVKTLEQFVRDYLLPQDTVDVGLMLLPGGKVARKVGAGLVAGGAATDAEAGVFRTLPRGLKAMAERLGLLAREADPEAAVEFANQGSDIVRGAKNAVTGLRYEPGGTALHTHGYGERVSPSSDDLEEWADRALQKYYGVVRPEKGGKGTQAFIFDLKGTPMPTAAETGREQMSLYRKYPELRAAYPGENELSRLKWFIDRGNADDVDLYLHNLGVPPQLLYPNYKTPAGTLKELVSRGTNKLTAGELEHLMSYMSEGGSGINRALRSGQRPTSSYWLDSAFKSSAPLSEDLAVWRYAKEFPPVNPGYVSTTLDPEFARRMAQGLGGFKKVIVPKGERVLSVEGVSPFAYEREVLLPRGGSFSPIDENTLMFSSKPKRKARGGLNQIKECSCHG